jgi:outer membrane lipoprotein SlyB
MSRTLLLALAIAVAITSTGCAVAPVANPNYSLVDPKGVDPAKYDQDYRECAALANQTDVGERATSSAAAGAVAGALIGALLGVAIGGNGSYAGYGAGMGAASGVSQGAVAGAASGAQEQQLALRRCLIGRGYSVIR